MYAILRIKLGGTKSIWKSGPNAHVKVTFCTTLGYNWHEESESFDSYKFVVLHLETFHIESPFDQVREHYT